METIIGIIVIGILYFVFFKLPEIRYDNYSAPSGYTVDHDAVNRDLMVNGMSKEDVMKKTVNGGYDIKKK